MLSWNALGGWHDTVWGFDFYSCSETRVGIKEKMVLLKTGHVKAEETWVGSLFQTRDAVDEKDFDVAIDVFINGAAMVIEEEDRSDCKAVCILEEFEQGTKAVGGARREF